MSSESENQQMFLSSGDHHRQSTTKDSVVVVLVDVTEACPGDKKETLDTENKGCEEESGIRPSLLRKTLLLLILCTFTVLLITVCKKIDSSPWWYYSVRTCSRDCHGNHSGPEELSRYSYFHVSGGFKPRNATDNSSTLDALLKRRESASLLFARLDEILDRKSPELLLSSAGQERDARADAGLRKAVRDHVTQRSGKIVTERKTTRRRTVYGLWRFMLVRETRLTHYTERNVDAELEATVIDKDYYNDLILQM